jgi:acyl-CoA thioester hydrolase
MSRVKIDIPADFTFSTNIPVRITDINYGGHVGNDTMLSMLHEARAQYLAHYNYTELNCGGPGLIMSDVAIEFKNELFYGDIIIASVTAGAFSKVAFDVYYKLEKHGSNGNITIAVAKTGMVCYDYAAKKIVSIPPEVKEKLTTA